MSLSESSEASSCSFPWVVAYLPLVVDFVAEVVTLLPGLVPDGNSFYLAEVVRSFPDRSFLFEPWLCSVSTFLIDLDLSKMPIGLATRAVSFPPMRDFVLVA